MIATNRTYSLVSRLAPFLVIRFVVPTDPQGNPLVVNIYLESSSPNTPTTGWGCPIPNDPNDPEERQFYVATDKPMLGISADMGRFIWNLLVERHGWQQLIHTP